MGRPRMFMVEMAYQLTNLAASLLDVCIKDLSCIHLAELWPAEAPIHNWVHSNDYQFPIPDGVYGKCQKRSNPIFERHNPK